jgi:UDP-N-acetylglucosamine 2-epimerase (non-hydrolysing)
LPESLHASEQVIICDPVGYFDFIALEQNARAVLTDSGGVQEETTALGVPCLTLRENTERPSTVDLGTNTLVGLNPGMITDQLEAICAGRYKRGELPPLWDGRAAERIASSIAGYLGDSHPQTSL